MQNLEAEYLNRISSWNLETDHNVQVHMYESPDLSYFYVDKGEQLIMESLLISNNVPPINVYFP